MHVPIVHFQDIETHYPAVLCLMMATAATLYASIQMFDFEGWQHYYYHPTINPLAERGIISVFLALVWVIIIMSVASISEVTKHLKPLDATVYLLSLFAVCCVDYVLFSQLTLYYIGYPLLVAYYIFAFCKMIKDKRSRLRVMTFLLLELSSMLSEEDKYLLQYCSHCPGE